MKRGSGSTAAIVATRLLLVAIAAGASSLRSGRAQGQQHPCGGRRHAAVVCLSDAPGGDVVISG